MNARQINVTQVASGKETARQSTSALSVYLDYSIVEGRLRAALLPVLTKHHLTINNWLILGVIGQHSRQGITPSNVSRSSGISSTQLTNMIASLTKDGLVKQRVGRQDRRTKRLLLTAKGKATLKHLSPQLDQLVKGWLTQVPGNYFVFYRRVLAVLAGNEVNLDS